MPKNHKLFNLLNQTIEAELTWTGKSFESGLQIAINSEGRISSIGSNLSKSPIFLRNQLILPGFVNVHSHCFQSALRLK